MNARKPPENIPAELCNEYTLNGKIEVVHNYRNDAYAPEKPIIYTKEEIDSYITRIKRKETFYYGELDSSLYRALEKYSIGGKNVAIIGSVTPLYESICLTYGAKSVTIEYNKIVSEDSRLKVLTVDEYDKNPIRFDAAFSISSFEHSGLGRYGEPLNPKGDLEAMNKMRFILKEGGLLFLSVPVGKDIIEWNSRRIYGTLRLPKLLAGWKLVDIFDTKNTAEPIFVLANTRSGHSGMYIKSFLYKKYLGLKLKRILERIKKKTLTSNRKENNKGNADK